MALVLKDLLEKSQNKYKDLRYQGSEEELEKKLKRSTTIYVGNLTFFTREEQIHELFSKCGDIKRIIMGLDRQEKTPCGFCFVEYYERKGAEACVKYLNGSRLDERIIRCDIDSGFVEGRQYGRGKSGGQVRDEYRQDFDPGRGGFGKLYAQQIEDPNRKPKEEDLEKSENSKRGRDEDDGKKGEGEGSSDDEDRSKKSHSDSDNDNDNDESAKKKRREGRFHDDT